MLENILLDLFILLCAMIGLACALIPFYKKINDDINERFKDQ
jgi:cytochrome c oxidase assembly protein Cox11